MSSIERLYSLYNAIQYIVKYDIPGDIVECGVWRGGSSMLCALTLNLLGDNKRKLFLYDTYKGLTKPSEKDLTCFSYTAKDRWEKAEKKGRNKWCYAQ